MVEIRAVEPEELEEYKKVASTCLVMSPELLDGVRPQWTLCAFDNGKLATSYAVWPLTMRFNGKAVPVAGVTSVGTLPAYRRRGLLRKVVTRHLESLYQEKERPLAILVASMAAIYQRYGYAVVSAQNAYNVEPRYVQFAQREGGSGLFRAVEGEDGFGLMVDLYRRFRQERTGYIHRGRATWKAGVLAPPPPGGILTSVVYEEQGVPLGYLVYCVQPSPEGVPGPGQRLTIRDLVWLSASAYRATWAYLERMDLVTNIHWPRVPPDDPLPHLLLEPRMLHASSRDGILARVVDVEKALCARGYQGQGTLMFEIIDELCPWNVGSWTVDASPEGASVRRGAASVQLAMPISSLAMILLGQISATEAARMDRLRVLDPEALPVWDAVMRTAHRPFCADFF